MSKTRYSEAYTFDLSDFVETMEDPGYSHFTITLRGDSCQFTIHEDDRTQQVASMSLGIESMERISKAIAEALDIARRNQESRA